MILVALGANLAGPWGGPAAGILAAVERFPAYGLTVEKLSPLYRTPAITPYAQPDFINAVARISAALPPADLLAQLHRIESDFGRVRTQRWSERTLDLDLIDYDGLILKGDESGPDGLVLPHPRTMERGFVLVPLCDMAPDWRHPVDGRDAKTLLAALPDEEKRGIVRISAVS
jgi:2-amino-4-hydroxy-6-hydroxymethyldihydropteridine diphosphokinase